VIRLYQQAGRKRRDIELDYVDDGAIARDARASARERL
jgi:hypothetical protein